HRPRRQTARAAGIQADAGNVSGPLRPHARGAAGRGVSGGRRSSGRRTHAMKHAERITPIAAALSALATLACCLPLGLVGLAAAAAGVSALVDRLRPELLGLSVVLLGVAGYQIYRARATCQPRSRVSVTIWWLSACIVILVIAFPDLIAG